MSQVMMHPLMLAVSFALNLGGAAFADTVQFTSLVSELNAVELSKLPLGHARTQDDNRWQCALVAEEISSAAGKVVVANNWRVTSEVERAGLTFVSFVANAEPGTSGSCMQSDGNVGIFRGESLLGIIYVNNASKRTIGSIDLHSPGGVSFEVKIACIRSLDKDFLPQAAPAVAQTAGSGRIRPRSRCFLAQGRRFSAQRTDLSSRFRSV